MARGRFPTKRELTQDYIDVGGATYYVSVYDNGGKTADRYTIVFDTMHEAKPNTYTALGLSAQPSSPQGVSQFTTAMKGAHLGRRIHFVRLPANVQAHVRARLQQA